MKMNDRIIERPSPLCFWGCYECVVMVGRIVILSLFYVLEIRNHNSLEIEIYLNKIRM